MLLKDNVLLDKPDSWDVNFRENQALEVVNESGVPVFQLQYINASTAILHGLFTDGKVIISVGAHTTGVPTAANPLPYDLERIFKYPAFSHMGEFIDK